MRKSPPFFRILSMMAFWKDIASAVTMFLDTSTLSRSLGTEVISLLFSRHMSVINKKSDFLLEKPLLSYIFALTFPAKSPFRVGRICAFIQKTFIAFVFRIFKTSQLLILLERRTAMRRPRGMYVYIISIPFSFHGKEEGGKCIYVRRGLSALLVSRRRALRRP